jgi:TPR repeat protein
LNIILINLKLCLLECWDGEPDNRPTIYQVIDLLKSIIAKADIITENSQLSNNQELDEAPLCINSSETQGELSQLIQNFNKMNTKEFDAIAGSNNQEKLLTEKDFGRIIEEVNDLIFELLNKGTEWQLLQDQVIDYFNSHNIILQDIYNWLLYNQNISNSIFLLGYFNYRGIETSVNVMKAFNLFLNASEKNHILAHYFVGNCYQYGNGIIKNEKLAFEYYEKSANKDFAHGQSEVACFYENGIGVKKDLKKAFYMYEKAANNGNMLAMYNLGKCYLNEIGVKKDYNKAFELIKQSAEGGHPRGITALGNCYLNGIGTKIDKKKAFELYQKLGQVDAKYNLGIMYEYGQGFPIDIDKAIYWYEQSAKQGYQDAQNKLKVLKKSWK